MTNKAKTIKIVTPRASALFAKLSEANRHFCKKPQDPGTYEIGLVYDPNDPAWKAIEAQLDDLIDNEAREMVDADRWEDAKDDPSRAPARANYWRADKQKDGDEVVRTGLRVMSPRMKEFWPGKNGKPDRPNKVAVYDSMTQRLLPIPEIGNGSVVQARFVAAPYWHSGQGKYGVSLSLEAVILRELKSYGADDSAAGFEADDAGYVGAPVEDTWDPAESPSEPEHEAADL